jgi:iron(III) transport system ATP-binding protein
MSHPAIECEGLAKRFGDTVAVDIDTLEVPPGETLALLGPSGCGKTTLLRLIAGFERPDAGTIRVRGREVVGPRKFVAPDRRRIGFVFQDYALFPHLKVAGNIAFGVPAGPGRKKRVAQMLELIGLSGKAQCQPHELSGGEQQRVAIARALAPNPDVVLLDEPFSNLDASLRTQVREDLVKILRTAGATAIFVTHDREEALSVGTKIAVMQRGRILEIATPREIYLNPQTREAARAVGASSLLRGRAEGGFAHCDLGRLPLGRPCTMGRVEILLRPESIRLAPLPRSGSFDGLLGTTAEAEIIDLRFHGGFQALAIRLAGGQVLQVNVGPGHRLHVGDRVGVLVQDPVIAFPVDQEEGEAGAGGRGTPQVK